MYALKNFSLKSSWMLIPCALSDRVSTVLISLTYVSGTILPILDASVGVATAPPMPERV